MTELELTKALMMAVETKKTTQLSLTISLPESKGSAQVDLSIYAHWGNLPPVVTCKEPWVKTGDDWHVYSSKRLCYIFDDEWADEVFSVQKTLDRFHTTLYLSKLLILNVTYLLDRHFLAEQLEITQWLPEWPARPHGRTDALEDYTQQMKTN